MQKVVEFLNKPRKLWRFIEIPYVCFTYTAVYYKGVYYIFGTDGIMSATYCFLIWHCPNTLGKLLLYVHDNARQSYGSFNKMDQMLNRRELSYD